MHAPVLHRWFYALACLAMLLVLVAPLISRLTAHAMVGAMQAPAVHAGHPPQIAPASPGAPDAHPMQHGMQHGMDHAMPMTPSPAKPADPHAEHEMGVDCEYCLIAARMISLLVAMMLFMALWPPVFRALAGLVDTRRVPAHGTLGARGPPFGVAC